jgi:uncharacterized membrane protein
MLKPGCSHKKTRCFVKAKGLTLNLIDLSSTNLKERQAKLVWIASLATSAILLLLPFIFKLDGRPHADWQQFLGRFHPLVVHLPIGLILLVPVLELAGRSRSALREAAAFVLSLSLFACVAAVVLGYLLAYGSGTTGAGVIRHMWAGIALTIGVLICSLVRPSWAQASSQSGLLHLYPIMLACLILLLAWTAHQGGSITHGDNYLVEYLPAPLKRGLFAGSSSASESLAPSSFYARHIHPVLDANCVACHGEASVKGGLRMDTYASLMKGGQDGPVVFVGQPDKSILFERITLPTSHKKFMPAEGKPPLKAEEIAWIRAWIQQGASPTLTSLAGVMVREESKELPLPQVDDYSGRMAEINQAAHAEGVTLVPVSSNMKDGLILNTVNVSSRFGDAQLAQLDKYAPYIVEVELGRTAVTNACFDTLSKFSHLRAIHLEGTAVTGDGLTKLTRLSQLTYLNLSETKVTQAAIAPLNSMKNLRHLYLYDTPAQPIAAATAEAPEAK